MPRGKLNKRYTPEFKIKVAETMHKEKLSYCEAARQFDVSSDTVVAKWYGKRKSTSDMGLDVLSPVDYRLRAA